VCVCIRSHWINVIEAEQNNAYLCPIIIHVRNTPIIHINA